MQTPYSEYSPIYVNLSISYRENLVVVEIYKLLFGSTDDENFRQFCTKNSHEIMVFHNSVTYHKNKI